MKNLLLRGASSTARGRVFNFSVLITSFLLLIFSLPSTAQSSYPDINGTWTGSLSGADLGCSPPETPGSFSDSVTIAFSNQSEGSFDVKLVAVSTTPDDLGDVTTLMGHGSFLTMTTLSFNVHNSEDNVNVNATLSGSTMSFDFNGTDAYCSFQGSGSVNRASGNLSNLNPATEASSTVTGVALFYTALNNFFNSLGAHIGSSLSGGGNKGLAFNGNGFNYEGNGGLNAGDGGVPYGVWGNYTYSNFENDLSSTAFDGHTHSLLGGVDYAPIKGTVLGVAVGYSNDDVDTTFNRGNQDNDTFTIAPYFGMVINDTWSIDANIGYSRVNTDQYRTSPGTTIQVDSSPSADRWFGALNLNGVTYVDKWILGGRVGVSRAKSTQDSFVESNGTRVSKVTDQLGTLSIGANIAHSFGKYEPFVSATYENDYRITRINVISGPQPANDRDDFLVGIGVRYFGGSNGLSGILEYNKRLGRTNFDEDILNFSLRADF